MGSNISASGAERVVGEGVRSADRCGLLLSHGRNRKRSPDPLTSTPPDAVNGGGRIEKAAWTAAWDNHSQTRREDEPSWHGATERPPALTIASKIDSASSGEPGERHSVLVAELADHIGVSQRRVRNLFTVRGGRVFEADVHDFKQAQFERAEADAAHAQDDWS